MENPAIINVNDKESMEKPAVINASSILESEVFQSMGFYCLLFYQLGVFLDAL